ncbi:hypothetical protein [Oceanobacillus bengalensis]|uniref:ABC transporter permease n=1 Tax=Oceanobacillus bengalensis TaxID=1435466 RepID=A0A494YS52_9BACI|nr:hypothetical protein [Oceanobacillus bengalensis]RKQ12504.1 hypothetical protein D8M05_18045 [Oceanobacillus bengalensis]
MIKDAIRLAKMEYKHHFMAVILTFLASIFIGLITGLLLTESSAIKWRVDSPFMNRLLLDLIFVGVAPAFATFFMAKPYLSFQTAKHDPYVKRMALLRTLPVPVSVLALSRTLLMLSSLVIMSLAFYGTMIAVVFINTASFSELMTASELFIFIVVWLGYMLTMGGLNPYIEYGTSGKTLHTIQFIFGGIFLIFALLLYKFRGQGIVEISIQLVKSIGWPMAIISIVIGIICCIGWNKLLKNRLENRDYL